MKVEKDCGEDTIVLESSDRQIRLTTVEAYGRTCIYIRQTKEGLEFVGGNSLMRKGWPIVNEIEK